MNCIATAGRLIRPSKRVFILGPAHHIYLTGCALSKFKTYDTPLGELTLDLDSMSLVLLKVWCDTNSFNRFFTDFPRKILAPFDPT